MGVWIGIQMGKIGEWQRGVEARRAVSRGKAKKNKRKWIYLNARWMLCSGAGGNVSGVEMAPSHAPFNFDPRNLHALLYGPLSLLCVKFVFEERGSCLKKWNPNQGFRHLRIILLLLDVSFDRGAVLGSVYSLEAFLMCCHVLLGKEPRIYIYTFLMNNKLDKFSKNNFTPCKRMFLHQLKFIKKELIFSKLWKKNDS